MEGWLEEILGRTVKNQNMGAVYSSSPRQLIFDNLRFQPLPFPSLPRMGREGGVGEAQGLKKL